MKEPYVYDIEQLINCHTNTFKNIYTKGIKQFVIHNLRNDINEYIKFLEEETKILVGFNNLEYDYPLLHYILINKSYLQNLDPDSINSLLYKESQRIIDAKNNGEFVTIRFKDELIHQVDLYKIWHYDNKAKATSLKALECHMGFHTVQEMPIHHTTPLYTIEEINQVLLYNLNDVEATYEFYLITRGKTENPLYKGKDKLQLRFDVRNKYKIDCLNYNDIKLGTELILKLYCNKFDKNPYDVKKLRTYRKYINLKDCLPKWVNFKSKEFKQLQEKFEKTSISNGETKGVVDFSVIYRGIKIDYGTGGAHAGNPGIYDYRNSNTHTIIDLDIDGMYPNLAISQGLYPQHLGKEFIEIYDGEIVSKRTKEKKKPEFERDFVIVEGYKLASNGFFGKSNSLDSYAFDPLYTMKTTISGQILISMWIELICTNIPDAQVIMVNTDGYTTIIPKDKYQLVLDLSDKFCQSINMSYEANEYKFMALRDVNNYIALTSKGKIKHKGCFEIDKELHKDSSFRIVPIALENYYIKGIPVEDTIKNHKNILDFYGRIKIDNRFELEFHSIKNDINNQPFKSIEKLQKVTRYLVTKNGGTIYKKDKNNKLIGVNIGYTCNIYNINNSSVDDFNINYLFYIRECNKIITSVSDGSLTLF